MNLNQASKVLNKVLNKHVVLCPCHDDNCGDCKEMAEARLVIDNMLNSINNSRELDGNEMNLCKAFQVLNNNIPACPTTIECDRCVEINQAREVINDMLVSMRNMMKHVAPRDLEMESCREISLGLKERVYNTIGEYDNESND